jgi:hypothetical protein
MRQVRCTECGSKSADALSLRVKGRWVNLCPRCAAAHRKRTEKDTGPGFGTVLLLLGGLVLVVGIIVWSFMNMK